MAKAKLEWKETKEELFAGPNNLPYGKIRQCLDAPGWEYWAWPNLDKGAARPVYGQTDTPEKARKAVQKALGLA